MAYDLTGVQELRDPQDFFQEIEVLQQLLKGARERQAQKKIQAIERARKIDEAAFGCPSPPPSSVAPTPFPEPAATTEAAPIASTDPYRAVRPPTFVVALNRWAARIGAFGSKTLANLALIAHPDSWKRIIEHVTSLNTYSIWEAGLIVPHRRRTATENRLQSPRYDVQMLSQLLEMRGIWHRENQTGLNEVLTGA
ncbi:hypothetical protein FIBSPDRAFT_906204 [Athelia psychrophila]|uniref:Uncharacterized protein n=1 Tax=Athelia psychrophila TaxID=1759441 RepID=A0A167SM21_9AGAM|nr:hypothetical protein FIBSPDRAFT_906204 [Fibularhizoctonia sp. CBS 109695]